LSRTAFLLIELTCNTLSAVWKSCYATSAIALAEKVRANLATAHALQLACRKDMAQAPTEYPKDERKTYPI
jgi:hypothetical protein